MKPGRANPWTRACVALDRFWARFHRPLWAWDVLLLSSVLLTAYGIKRYAAAAGADELNGLLGPTAALVEKLSGHDFVRERGTGYFNRELGLVIAPSCAGTNYLVVAFCTLALGRALGGR
jgi:exosortase K